MITELDAENIHFFIWIFELVKIFVIVYVLISLFVNIKSDNHF